MSLVERSASMPGKSLIRAISALFCLIALLLFVPAPSTAGMRAELSSFELFPGDAFSINISGVPALSEASVTVSNLQIPLFICGDSCLAGIGVIPPDTAPGKISIRFNIAGKKSEMTVKVRKPVYPERHIQLPDKKVSLSPEDLARAINEEKMLKAVWQVRSEKLYQGNFIMPLPNQVSAAYGLKRIFNKKNVSVHRGIDIKGAAGEEIKAANRGKVVVADNLFFGGNTLVLDHGLGIYTVYMHLERFAVKPGALVERGSTVGFVGSTGRATGPHLHFGLKILTLNANPVSIMGISLR
jgi:hypothetical protein